MGLITRFYNSFRRRGNGYAYIRDVRLAAVLLARGFPLVKVERTTLRFYLFVFRNSYGVGNVVEKFMAGKPVYVEARSFILAWKTLDRKINRERL